MGEIAVFVAALADAGFDFVFGGAITGVMGIVEREGLARGRSVIGVVTAAGEGSELYSTRLTSLEVVASRADRKARIMRLADVIVALPGGLGTLEEVAEAWSARGRGGAPECVLFNPRGFFDPLIAQLVAMEAAGLLAEKPGRAISTPQDVDGFIERYSKVENQFPK